MKRFHPAKPVTVYGVRSEIERRVQEFVAMLRDSSMPWTGMKPTNRPGIFRTPRGHLVHDPAATKNMKSPYGPEPDF